MTTWRSDSTLMMSALGANHDRRPAMDDHRTLERDTVTDDGVERRETIEKDYVPGVPRHSDEKAGGAVVGGVAGIAVGAVIGGPVGAVIGGAIGAASGATAGLLDEKRKDDEVIVTHEERSL
jgi:uncharacterized protein YcfJ